MSTELDQALDDLTASVKRLAEVAQRIPEITMDNVDEVLKQLDDASIDLSKNKTFLSLAEEFATDHIMENMDAKDFFDNYSHETYEYVKENQEDFEEIFVDKANEDASEKLSKGQWYWTEDEIFGVVKYNVFGEINRDSSFFDEFISRFEVGLLAGDTKVIEGFQKLVECLLQQNIKKGQ